MNKFTIYCVGLIAAGVFSQSALAGDSMTTGACFPAGPGQYSLRANLSGGYPSIGTDQGGHNFLTGVVYCNGRQAQVQTLRVSPNEVLVSVNDGRRHDMPQSESPEDGRSNPGGGGRPPGGGGGPGHPPGGGGPGGPGPGGLSNCTIDASVHWNTTRFYCR